MHLSKAFDRAAVLVRDVIRVEPGLASARPSLDRLFAGHGAAEALSDDFIALRRAATRRNWAEGLVAWNARAQRQLHVMRRYGTEAATARLLQRVFAADFSEAALGDGLDAAGATFAGDLLLDGATLSGALRLDGAQMLASLDASGLRITHDVTAEQAHFVGPVAMTGLSATCAVRFGFSTFRSDVTLDDATVGKDLWFRNATVAGTFSMRNARLIRDAGLGGCTYGGPVVCDGTRFGTTVSFEGSVFRDRLSLDGCTFAGRLWLQDADLSNGISVERARVLGDIVPPLHELVPIRSPQRDLMERLRRA